MPNRKPNKGVALSADIESAVFALVSDLVPAQGGTCRVPERLCLIGAEHDACLAPFTQVLSEGKLWVPEAASLGCQSSMQPAGQAEMQTDMRAEVQAIDLAVPLRAAQIESLARQAQRAEWIFMVPLPAAFERLSRVTLLGSLRNLSNARIVVFQPANEGLAFCDFIGLGFKRLAANLPFRSGQVVDVFAYNIATYNRKRAWNNAKHWANPENFGKYWW